MSSSLVLYSNTFKMMDKTERLDLNENVYYWIDNTGLATVWELVSMPADSFKLVSNSQLLLGKKNVWIKYDVENLSNEDRDWLFSVGAIKHAQMMLYINRSEFLFKDCGFDVPNFKNIHTNVVTSLKIPREWKHFSMYVSIPSSNAESLETINIVLFDNARALQIGFLQTRISGVILGFIVLLLLYHLFSYFFLFDRAYLFFCAYMTSLLILTSQDLYYMSLIQSPRLLSLVIIWANISAPLFYFRFLQNITDISTIYPRLAAVFRWNNRVVVFLAALFSVLLFVTNAVTTMIHVAYLVLIVFFILSLFLHIPLFKIKNLASRFFVSGTILLLLGITGGYVFLAKSENTILGVLCISGGMGLQLLLFSISLSARFRQIQYDKVAAQSELICQLEENQQLQLQLTSELEDKVRERTLQVVAQKDEIEEKNRQIMSSINYAKIIQRAMLPDLDALSDLPPHFVLYRPRDVVSGDFYLIKRLDSVNNQIIIAAADCTGHGVPGGFISMMGMSLLNEAIGKQINKEFSAASVLEQMRMQLKQMLKQELNSSSRDGIDIALCVLDLSQKQVQYSGAYLPLFIVRNGELLHYKAVRNPIGIHPVEVPFQNELVQLQSGDCLYLFSDGFQDQLGGEQYKRFTIERYKKLLCAIAERDMYDQKNALLEAFNRWKANNEQIDDVLIIGLRVP